MALQADDATIRDLETRSRDLDLRVATLDRERAAREQELTRARVAVEEEERRQRELQAKIQEHRQLHERNLSHLDRVKKAHEASAAMAQIELTRKVLAQEESDAHAAVARLQALRQSLVAQEAELATADEQQRAARDEIDAERHALAEEVRAARAKREDTARRVSRGALAKYERIRGSKRPIALYPLRGMSCGHCNTAIPLQRRNAMAGGGAIELCEACGVLLYASG
jgi:predicted  nucleic acid-binding Zn-ribbon protein